MTPPLRHTTLPAGVPPGYGYRCAGRYRYGFNGKESDDEGLGGGGSTYDYGFRIYNAGLAKFLSVDPLHFKYPMLSSYQYASNTPVWAIDLDGAEALVIQGSVRITCLLVSVSMNVSIAFTSTGVSLYLTPEAGLGTGISVAGGASVGYFHNIQDSEAFEGWGVNFGGSFFGNGGDISFGIGDQGLGNGGISAAVPKIGAGAGAEGHLSFGYSFLIGTFSYEDVIRNALQDLAVNSGIAREEIQYLYDVGKEMFDEYTIKENHSTESDHKHEALDIKREVLKDSSQNLQCLEHIKFDSNRARPGHGNLIVRDLNSGKDFGVNRNDDGTYRFDSGNGTGQE